MRTNCNYLGTELPYIYCNSIIPTPPSGYSVSYINHIGRHGSRYIVSNHNIPELAISSADQQITYLSELYLSQVNNKLGLLTDLGYFEQFSIAQRLCCNYSPLLHKKFFAESTYITRCKESMNAFINGLKVIFPNINIQSSVNGETDPILRFFDLNPTYLQYKNHGAWINELHKYKFRDPSYINNLSSILHLKTTSLNEKLNLCNTLYNINCNSYNIYFNSLFREFLNNQTLDYFWSNNNIRNYFEKGPGSTDNIAVNIAYPLLENIISTTNNALAHEEIGGTFRFAHAETLIPFAALINLCNYGIQYNTYTQINSNWKDYLIARMAANIQFIFYTCTNKPPLVTVLLNENYATLPLRSSNHFYEWSEVEHYFYNILDNLNIPSSNGTLTSF